MVMTTTNVTYTQGLWMNMATGFQMPTKADKGMATELTRMWCQGQGFFMHGSREMSARAPLVVGPIPEKTDYDFAAPYSHELLVKLTEMGYKVNNNGYEGGLADYILEKHNVQVSLHENLQFYINLWKSISPEYYVNHLWKSGPKKSSKEDVRDRMNALVDLAKSVEGAYKPLIKQHKKEKVELAEGFQALDLENAELKELNENQADLIKTLNGVIDTWNDKFYELENDFEILVEENNDLKAEIIKIEALAAIA